VLKDGWLCTGDLALFTEEGLLKIKGRGDDLIIKAGMNIYPQEVESALKLDFRVKDVYVVLLRTYV
jgi:long-chain acyl-CoA synthetase